MQIVAVLAIALWLVIASNAPSRADPISASILTAVGIQATATAVAVTTFALTTAFSIGVSYLRSALTSKPQAETPIGGSSGKLSAGGVVSRKFGVGTYMTGGSLAYANTWGQVGKTPNAIFFQVISLADLPGPQLREVWVNGVKCTYDPNATPGNFGIPIPEFTVGGQQHLWVRFYDGHQTTADAQLVAIFGGDADRPYSNRRIGYGVAYVIVAALVKEELFTGFPQFKFALDGVPLYDRRFDSTAGGIGAQRADDASTWAFSANVATIRENVLRGFRYAHAWQWGGQTITDAQLPAASWFAAQNECDVAVPLAGGGTEPQFRAGGEIGFDMSPADVLDALNKADNGRLAEIGGVYKTRSGAPGAAVFSFTDADILSSDKQVFEPFVGQGQQVNHVTARYVSPAEGWNLKDAPALVDADLETVDGRRLSTSVDYGFVSSGTQVQRLMRAERDTVRAWRRHTVPMPPDAYVLEPLDVVSWTSARNGYATKTFELVTAEDLANLNMGLALKELDPAAYNWTPGTHERPVIDGTITLLRPPPQPVVDWFVEPVRLNVGGIERAGIRFGWDADMPDVDGVRLQVRLNATAELQLDTEEGAQVFARGAVDVSQNLAPATQYQGRMQYRPASPRAAEWTAWRDVTTPDVRIQLAELSLQLDAAVRQVTERLQPTLDHIRADVDDVSAALNGQMTGIIERVGRVLIAAGSQYLDNKARALVALTTATTAEESIAALTALVEADYATTAFVNTAKAEAITSANATSSSALAAFVQSLLAGGPGGTAEGRIRLITASLPSGATTTIALEANASAPGTPVWKPAALYLDAMSAFTRARIRAGQFVYEDTGLNGGNPFAAFSVGGGEAIFNALLKADTANIKDAAVTNAKIGNAAISNAKIGTAEIQTLHAAGEAWTAIRVQVGGDQATVSAEVASVSKTCEGGGVVLFGQFHLDALAQPYQLYIQLSIDGSVVTNRPIIMSVADNNPGGGGQVAASSQGSHSVMFATSVTPGAHTFRLHVGNAGIPFGASLQTSSSVIIRSPTIVLLEAKR